jgi:hypothetical protein
MYYLTAHWASLIGRLRLTDSFWADFELDDEGEGDLADELVWSPQPGSAFAAVQLKLQGMISAVSSQPEKTRDRWKEEVFRVASRSQNPATLGASKAQLVLGRVQAGKTSNFTGVISLLADNGYRFFIVIAGITTNLRNQTLERLQKDLGVATDPGFEVVASDPQRDRAAEAQRLFNRLQASQSSSNKFASQFNKTLVYVVLKEDDHLTWINSVLAEFTKTSNYNRALASAPVAVIDDEVDQASPDTYTKSSDKVGVIHDLISSIRGHLTTHTYLGYTATPYANLLMEEGSALRCEMVTMLQPGPDYVGAAELFTPIENPYPSELTDWDFDRDTIPDSLKQAFAIFMAQASILNSNGDIRGRFVEEPMLTSLESARLVPSTMLIHPHAHTSHASKVYDELIKLKNNWVLALKAASSPEGIRDQGYRHLWDKFLYPAFAALGLSESEVSWELIEVTEAVIEHCEILEINQPGSTRGHSFPTETQFKTKPAWILIGGQLLDRGQTLPNLVNTYMPRPPGGSGKSDVRGNIDTLQQRGRFYGHRRQYKKLLRGWFDSDTLSTYREIAVVEPLHLKAVDRLDKAGLRIDKLLMVLELGAGDLKAVRSNVVPRAVRQLKNSTWLFRQTHFVKDSEANNRNRDSLALLTSQLDPDALRTLGESGATGRSNIGVEIDIHSLKGLLSEWVCDSREKNVLNVCSSLLTDYAHAGHRTAQIVFMSREQHDPYNGQSFGEYRSARPLSEAKGLAAAEETYRISGLTSSNDARYVSDKYVSVQVHYFDMRIATLGNPNQSSQIFPGQVGLAIAFPNSTRLLVKDGSS